MVTESDRYTTGQIHEFQKLGTNHNKTTELETSKVVINLSVRAVSTGVQNMRPKRENLGSPPRKF